MSRPPLKPLSVPVRTGLDEAPTGPGESTDEALMMQFCQGEARAFDALFQRYAGPLQGYLARIVGAGPTAEDLLQQTFLSLVRARGRFLRGARFKSWLYAIATNAARDHLRRRRPEELTPDGELPRTAATEASSLADAGLERAVQAALAQLPEGQRLPIVLHRYEGLSFAEIAEAMGLTETAVKVRAHRGYVRLRELLGPLRQELEP